MAQKDVGNKIPIYKLKTTNEVMEFYDEWGDNDKYNKDMADWDYTGPKETVNVFKKYAENKVVTIPIPSVIAKPLTGPDPKAKRIIAAIKVVIFASSTVILAFEYPI